jgi:hypothetical protein
MAFQQIFIYNLAASKSIRKDEYGPGAENCALREECE